MKNVIITLPEELARWLCIKAAKDNRSVSRWLAGLLERMQLQENQYEAAMKQYLEMKPCRIDWPNGRRPTREELYDRSSLR